MSGAKSWVFLSLTLMAGEWTGQIGKLPLAALNSNAV
jgi:hypothetical protein